METEKQNSPLQIAAVIRAQRRRMGIGQEELAAHTGVTVQAVSKWETENSLPDVALLPVIAAYFHISMDELFFGEEKAPARQEQPTAFADDGVYRVVQFCGGHLLRQDEYDPNRVLSLLVPADADFHLEVWGSARIQCNVKRGLFAGLQVSCGDVCGGVQCGGDLNCGDIDGDAQCSGNLNCGDIEGSILSCGGAACGDIGGDLMCRSEPTDTGSVKVSCGDIEGNVLCSGDLNCGDIDGDILSCSGNISCGDISGGIHGSVR